MKLTKKTLIWVLVIVVAGAALYFLVIKKGGAATAGSDGAPAVQQAASQATPPQPSGGQDTMPLPVKAVPARKGDVTIWLKSPGEAYTERKIVIKAEVGSVIKRFEAAEGRHVTKNALLVELDDREIRLNLHKLEARRLKALSAVLLEKMFSSQGAAPDPALIDKVSKAKTAFEAADASFRKGLVSQDEWEKSRREYELILIQSGGKKEELMSSDLTQIEDEVRGAELELEKATIRAPFPGVITDIKVSPDEHVTVGQDLFTLVDIGRLKVRASVLESEVGKMKAGREVDISFPAYPGRVFKGTVKAVSPLVKSEDRTCAVYIDVLNPGEEIKPGMHAEVEIAAEVYPDRLIVPQEAILVRNGRKLVFVVEDGLAKWRYVETGVENEKFAEIVDGVKEGEPVITEGHFTLAHDARVSVVKE